MLPIHKYKNGNAEVIHQVKISPIDSVILKVYKWYQHSKTFQIFTTRDGRRVYLQDMIKEPEKGRYIHVNGDKNDYRRENLVQVNSSVRTVKTPGKSSRTVGVCYVKSRDRWKATLSNKCLGYFKTEDEAAHARLKSLLASNPMINFVREGENPDGAHEMHVPSSYTQYGKPDTYFDLDDIEMYPMIHAHTTLGSDIFNYTRVYVSIPPPKET